MLDNYKIISASCFSYEEKNSKFIAISKYVLNKIEAENFLAQISNEHPKARHICYAYRILENEQLYQKSSDDGEPSGTAGRPILNILEKNNIINACVAVVRYFGGTKLGAGNLLRAYSGVASSVIKDNMSDIQFSTITKLFLSYLDYAVLLPFLAQNNIYYTMLQNQDSVSYEIDIKDCDKIKTFLDKNGIQFTENSEKIIKKI